MTTDGRGEDALRKGFEDGNIKVVQNSQGGEHQVSFDRLSKRRPLTYSGSSNPTELVEWLEEMETVMKLGKTPNSEKVVLATYFMEGEATHWWKCVKASQPDLDYTWAEFKYHLKEKYLGLELQWQKEKEFMDLSMGEMSLQKYTEEYRALSMFGQRFVSTEESLIRRYVSRMSPKLRSAMAEFENTTFAEAYGKATAIWAFQQLEGMEEKKKRTFVPKISKTSLIQKPIYQHSNFQKQNLLALIQQSNTIPTYEPPRNPKPNATPGMCRLCKALHPGKKCNGQPMICHNCHAPGHKLTECPNHTDASRSNHTIPNAVKQGITPQDHLPTKRCRPCNQPCHPGKQCNGQPIVCYHCHATGHKVPACPKRTNASGSNHTAPNTVQIQGRVHMLTDAENEEIPEASIFTGVEEELESIFEDGFQV